jgi:hypothetical protein
MYYPDGVCKSCFFCLEKSLVVKACLKFVGCVHVHFSMPSEIGNEAPARMQSYLSVCKLRPT